MPSTARILKLRVAINEDDDDDEYQVLFSPRNNKKVFLNVMIGTVGLISQTGCWRIYRRKHKNKKRDYLTINPVKCCFVLLACINMQ